MNKIHITTNIKPRSSVTTSLWTLFGENEPERVAVRFKNREYMIVLDEKPFFELWDLDDQGELNEMIGTVQPEE